MMPPAPVARCPRPYCGGWIERRALHVEEPPTTAFTCSHCSHDWELIAGALVAISRPLGAAERRLLARTEKTVRAADRRKVEAGT